MKLHGFKNCITGVNVSLVSSFNAFFNPSYFVFEEYLVQHARNWGPFLERPNNFSGPKANFEIKTCLVVAQVLAHKAVSFASLLFLVTDSFIA